MTTPREEQSTDVPAGTGPTVSTAPPRSRWSLSRVPSHLGPARTSPVVLAVLFVLLLGLHSYLQAHSQNGYTTVTTDTGQRVRVRSADLSAVPTPPASSPASATTTPRTTPPSTTPAPPPSSTGSATTTTSQRTTSSSATRTSAPATATSSGVGPVPTVPATGTPSG